ncbi:MAG: hypothetical protein Q8807_03145 ['Waltheria sp.' little leaf phytoplasma]|nr:hypothetical protein ['Waltheria sp.' little leaf phytoplasma]
MYWFRGDGWERFWVESRLDTASKVILAKVGRFVLNAIILSPTPNPQITILPVRFLNEWVAFTTTPTSVPSTEGHIIPGTFNLAS